MNIVYSVFSVIIVSSSSNSSSSSSDNYSDRGRGSAEHQWRLKEQYILLTDSRSGQNIQ